MMMMKIAVLSFEFLLLALGAAESAPLSEDIGQAVHRELVARVVVVVREEAAEGRLVLGVEAQLGVVQARRRRRRGGALLAAAGDVVVALHFDPLMRSVFVENVKDMKRRGGSMIAVVVIMMLVLEEERLSDIMNEMREGFL